MSKRYDDELACYELNISIDHFTVGIMNIKLQTFIHPTSVHSAYDQKPPYFL